jgi:hypothetical protein
MASGAGAEKECVSAALHLEVLDANRSESIKSATAGSNISLHPLTRERTHTTKASDFQTGVLHERAGEGLRGISARGAEQDPGESFWRWQLDAVHIWHGFRELDRSSAGDGQSQHRDQPKDGVAHHLHGFGLQELPRRGAGREAQVQRRRCPGPGGAFDRPRRRVGEPGH